MPIEPYSGALGLRAIALSLLASSSLALVPNQALSQAQVGTSAAVQGNVFVRGGATGTERRAEVRESIFLSDQVLTKQESALQILLLDASIFTVGENCELTIDRFVYDPDTGAGEMSARLTRGAMRFMSGRIGKNNPSSASITTQSATIGIRGTFAEIAGLDDTLVNILRRMNLPCMAQADLNTGSIVLLRGPGRGRNTLDETGVVTVANEQGSVTVSEANYFVFVPARGAAPCGPFELTDELRNYMDFYLRSRPMGDPVNPLDIRETAGTQSNETTIVDPPQQDDPRDDPSIVEGLEDLPPVPELPPPPPPPPDCEEGSCSVFN